MAELDYIRINKELWNQRTEFHVNSEFYGLEAFIEGKSSLNEIELNLLGDIKGKRILHLQCHFGQDTLSLGRLGAEVTGVDLSDKAIEKAKWLAEKTGVEAEFICCNVYDLPQHLNKQFDLVFTSYGTIGWLPDLSKWAQIVQRYLVPGGKLFLVEFHPVVWMFDNQFEKIGYNYFNESPIIETETGTYADRDAPIQNECITWNHPLSEVFTSLLQEGIQISSFNEYDYSPYNCFAGTIEFEPGKFQIEHLGNKIPMVYALVATKGN